MRAVSSATSASRGWRGPRPSDGRGACAQRSPTTLPGGNGPMVPPALGLVSPRQDVRPTPTRRRGPPSRRRGHSSVGVDPSPSRRADPGRERRFEERGAERRPRLFREDLRRGSVQHDPPLSQHHDPIERLGDEAHVVADRDDRPACLGEVGDDPVDPGDAACVLPGRRLVEDDDRGLHREDRRERQQLALRIPEVVRVRVGLLVEPGRDERAVDRLIEGRAGPAQIAWPERDLVADLAGEDLPIRILEGQSDRRREVGDASAERIRSVDPDPPGRRSKEPVEVPDQRRLAGTVLADDRHPLPGPDLEIDPVEGARLAGIDVDEALGPDDGLGRHDATPASDSATTRGSTPRSVSARVRRARAGGSTPSARRPDRRTRSAVGPSWTIRPPSITTIRLHSPSSRSVLCSAIRRDVPSVASARSASPTRRVSRRIELGRRLVEDHVARLHREQRRDAHELGLAAGEPLRIALDQVLQVQPADRLAGPGDGLHDGQSQVHRSEGDLLEHRCRDPRPLRVRVLEADDDPFGELVGRQPGGGHAIERQRPAQGAADRRGSQPGGHQAQGRLARLVRPHQPDDLAVVEAQVDVLEHLCGVAGVAVGRALELEHQGSAGNVPVIRPRIAATSSEQQRRPQDQLARGVGDPPEQLSPAGPPERPDLEREAALLDLRQRRQDDGARRAAGGRVAEPGRCPRCRGRGPVGRWR